MNNITHKTTTLRKAIAQARVQVSSEATMQAIQNKTVPKGDVFEFARAAGLLGIKKTSDLIPDCHPLPIEFAAIRYNCEELSVTIEVEVHAIYRTGVEVEAMHGASITALTLYDMLKPIDKGVEIKDIKLVEKKGGKSQYRDRKMPRVKVQVTVCSDTVSQKLKEDKSGKVILEKVKEFGLEEASYTVIPDEPKSIEQTIQDAQANGVRLLFFTGGTGLSIRDVTPDTIRPMLDREIPGMMEAARSYGQERMPYAMLSRGVAGMIGDMLVVTMPGSTGGARETMDAIFPHILHVFNIAAGKRHEA
mgnify:CR=1 FL=1